MNTFNRQVTATVTVPVSTTYLDEFLKSKCAPDLLPFFQCNEPAKEITESMAALRWAIKAIGWAVFDEKGDWVEKRNPRQDENVVCLVVGDGVLPRTGALVAHKTKWKVWSVDPLMRVHDSRIANVERLTCVQAKIEDMTDRINGAEIGVLLAVHSHAPLQAGWDRLDTRRKVAVAIPCCVEQVLNLNLGHEVGEDCSMPWMEKRDSGILSEKNLVKVWRV